MTRSVLAPAALLFVACGGSANPGTSDAATREAEVERLLGRYVEAVDTRDTAAIRAMLVDDGRFQWVEDGRVQYDSPEGLLAGVTSIPAEMTIRTEYGEFRVASVGADGAIASTTFSTTMAQESFEYAFAGSITMVLEAQPDGWRVVSGHTSTLRERPAGP